MAARKQVLVAGGTGFIGRRLVPELLRKGVAVRCLSRRPPEEVFEGVEVVPADLTSPSGLDGAMAGIDAAYYLVHSMGEGRKRFTDLDRRAATNFVRAAEESGVRRVIYLSGLGEGREKLSRHLQSREEVAGILEGGRFATTVLRAAIIIGAGGASYEMIRFLVKTQPVLPDRDSLGALCQPIALDDVVAYLVGCLAEEATAGERLDIGGPEVFTYREMLQRFAAVARTTNLSFPLPFLWLRAIAWWIGMATPVSSDLALALLEGIGHDVVCRDDRIRTLVPVKLTPFDEAVRKALVEGTRGRQVAGR